MARKKFEATDRSVSDAYESRQLVRVIFSYANYQNDNLREVCIRLHNTGITRDLNAGQNSTALMLLPMGRTMTEKIKSFSFR
jgi:hypothetical protein